MASSPLVIIPVLAARGRVDVLLEPIAGESALSRTARRVLTELPEAKCVVTSDSARVLDAARDVSLQIITHRRKERDYVAALVDALDGVHPEADVVVVLEPTHPFRPTGLVGRLCNNLLRRADLDTVVCARRISGTLWQRRAEGEIDLISEEGGDSLSLDFFQELLGLGIGTRSYVLRLGRRVGEKIGFEVLDDFWALTDLRDESGLPQANQLASFFLAHEGN